MRLTTGSTPRPGTVGPWLGKKKGTGGDHVSASLSRFWTSGYEHGAEFVRILGPPKLVFGYRNTLSNIVAGYHDSGMSRSHRTEHKKQLPYPPIERVTSPSQEDPPFSVVSQKNVYNDHPSSCSQGITCYSRTSTVSSGGLIPHQRDATHCVQAVLGSSGFPDKGSHGSIGHLRPG